MAKDKIKEYYVTKYALTKGILIVPARHAEVTGGYLYYGNHPRTQVTKNDWFTDMAEAKKRFEQLKARKIASLQNQLHDMKQKPCFSQLWSPVLGDGKR